MTMLIAGHETTAAVLTWAVFFLAQVFISNSNVAASLGFRIKLCSAEPVLICFLAEPVQDEESARRD